MWSLGMPCAWHFAAKGHLSCGKPAERRGGARWNRAADGCPHAASEPITLFLCVTFFFFFLSSESEGQSVPSPPSLPCQRLSSVEGQGGGGGALAQPSALLAASSFLAE